VGNNDGSVEGKRYFQTVPQRGVFVKIDDFKIINTNDKKAK
jgi:dynactin complex subunit